MIPISNRGIDLTGKRYGKLVALERNDKDKQGRWRWLCKCDCGKSVVVKSNNLRTGNSKSCGCSKHELGKTIRDLKGMKFGRLTVLYRDMERVEGGSAYWVCACDCGEVVSVIGKKLSNGTTKSCKIKGNHTESMSWRHAIWAHSVKENFNFTCQKCGDRGDNSSLHAHHILSSTAYPGTRFDISNGSCLCIKCHKEFHKKFGVMRNSVEDFENWLKEEQSI